MCIRDSPTIVSNLKSQALSKTQNKTNNTIKTTPNLKDRKDSKVIQEKKPIKNSSLSPIKTTARPPIQLIEKPKNLANSNRNINTNKINNSVNQRAQLSNKNDNNNNFPKKNLNSPNVKNTPELVGAPIRREDPKINSNRPNTNSRQPSSNTPISANRGGIPNRQANSNRPSRQNTPNRLGILIERALQVDQGGRSKINKVFQIDKAGLIDKVLLIDQGGRIGKVFQIDKAGHIDREISIGAVRN